MVLLFFFTWDNFSNFVISRPGGGSDHQTGFRNGKLRRFAIGAVYHFFLWDGMSEKLEHFESANEKNWDRKISSIFSLKIQWKWKNFEIEKFSIFFQIENFSATRLWFVSKNHPSPWLTIENPMEINGFALLTDHVILRHKTGSRRRNLFDLKKLFFWNFQKCHRRGTREYFWPRGVSTRW